MLSECSGTLETVKFLMRRYKTARIQRVLYMFRVKHLSPGLSLGKLLFAVAPTAQVHEDVSWDWTLPWFYWTASECHGSRSGGLTTFRLCVSWAIYHISLLYWNEWGLKEVVMLHKNNKNNHRDGTKQNLRPRKSSDFADLIPAFTHSLN